MMDRFKERPGRLLALVLASAAFLAVMVPAVAMAAQVPDDPDPQSFEQLFMQLQNTPVYKDACTKTCHGNIAQTSNYASAIIFQHGFHQLVACSSCHPRFPHRADTTIERPDMKGCFDCHGVRHGPMGIIASDTCEDCHVTPKERLRPAFHTFGWSGREHVEPSNQEFNTKCAMCHTPASCTDCHDRLGIKWSPASWEYNAGDGCLACHGDTGLSKASSGGFKSFEVTGLQASAHTDVTCQECHPDYSYNDQPHASELWTVNASNACASCHAGQEDPKLSGAVDKYNASVHKAALDEGNYDSATCGSCHGGHFIARTDTELAKQRMHLSSFRTCARCKQHGEDYDTYDDYYHGKAYKTGATDAPACWDCHAAHDILPKDDPESMISDAKIADTCGTEGCHSSTGEQFGATSAALIHSKVKEQEANPLLRLVARITGR